MSRSFASSALFHAAVGPTVALGAIAVVVALDQTARSQCDLAWESGYGLPGGGIMATCAEGFDDGTGYAMYVGGYDLLLPDGQTAPLVRYNGTHWEPVPGFPEGIASVQDLLVFDDGSGPALYLCGQQGVARWDGKSWLGPINVYFMSPKCLAAFDDGSGDGPQLYVGGDGSPCVWKWNGSSFFWVGGAQWAGMPVPWVSSLVAFDSGGGPKLVAGGNFTVAGGVAANYVAQWNGSSWSALGEGVSYYPPSMAAYDDGSGPALYVGGLQSPIRKWKNGQWSSISENVSAWTMRAFDDGSGSGPALFVGGSFASIGGITVNHMAKWNGTNWLPLGAGVAIQSITNAGAVRDLAVHAAPASCRAKLVAVGTIHSAGEVSAGGAAVWDGADWSSIGVGHGATDVIFSFAACENENGNTQLVAAGKFLGIGGIAARHVARFDGETWVPMPGLRGEVYSVLVKDGTCGDDMNVYVGGRLIVPGFPNNQGVAYWDGDSWTGLGLIVPNNGWVGALAQYDDGSGAGPHLHAGGRFVSGTVSGHIARWDGQTWTPVGGGVSYPDVFGDGGAVRSLHVFHDGANENGVLIAGGRFNLAGNVQTSNIAAWDGTDWTPLGGLNDEVFALTSLNPNGQAHLVAGGNFTMSSDGQLLSRIAQWDGRQWLPLAAGTNGIVFSLAVSNHASKGGQTLYAGGTFASASGLPVFGVAKWDGENWQALGGGITSCPETCFAGVRSIALMDNQGRESLMVGGGFPIAGNALSYNLARWSIGPHIELISAPADQLSVPGGTAGFSIEASAPSQVSHQWRRNHEPLRDDDHISGSTTPVLTITNVNALHQGQYDVEISGECGSISSPSARLIVSTCCVGDVEPLSGNGVVDEADLLAVIGAWGPCSGCPTDVNADGQVDVADLLAVINAWGDCP